jgi:hypothetical protein
VSSAWDTAYAAIGITVGVITILGAAVKWVLLPYIERELIHPVKQTHHQVTVNHHSSDSPTVLDRIDDVMVVAERAESAANRAEASANRARADLAEHLLNSERIAVEGHKEGQRLWAAVEAITKAEPPKAD